MILHGDVIDKLQEIESESVQCVVTSPPYWGLRDYGIEGQLGLEKTPEEYVEKMVEIFREIKRVLKDDGTCWLNLGDSYAQGGSGGSSMKSSLGYGGRVDHPNRGKVKQSIMNKNPILRKPPVGLKSKDLVGIPFRVAFALQADGWWLRQDIIWHKPNPMPESVTDRCTKSHEYIFLLTKSAKYFYDADAIKEDSSSNDYDKKRMAGERPDYDVKTDQYAVNGGRAVSKEPNKRNKRSVWTITTKPYKEAHFAVFPPKIPELCIKAGTSEKGQCAECGNPYKRVIEKIWTKQEQSAKTKAQDIEGNPMYRGGYHNDGLPHKGASKFKGWQPTCTCNTDKIVPQIVLDPFLGSGTTGLVAQRLGRKWIGIELNVEYIKIAEKRVAQREMF